MTSKSQVIIVKMFNDSFCDSFDYKSTKSLSPRVNTSRTLLYRKINPLYVFSYFTTQTCIVTFTIIPPVQCMYLHTTMACWTWKYIETPEFLFSDPYIKKKKSVFSLLIIIQIRKLFFFFVSKSEDHSKQPITVSS